MSIQHYLRKDISITKPPTTCEVFQAAAIDTWERIKFSRTKPRMKIHETSITQNLIYEMNLLKEDYPGLNFTIYESTDEEANGDDLELKIFHGRQPYTYAIQAKIIYHDLKKKVFSTGKYPRMQHEVKGNYQVDLLLDYARRNQCIPVYLLYNFVSDSFFSSAFGCTLSSAYYLKKFFSKPSGQLKGNVKFSDLHNPILAPELGEFAARLPIIFPHFAIPWSSLVCFSNNLREDEVRNMWLLPNDHSINSKSKPAIRNTSKWRGITNSDRNESDDINFTSKYNGDNRRDGNNEYLFNPKFRIVVGE